MTFLQAVEAMRQGKRIRRPDWQPHEFIYLRSNRIFCDNDNELGAMSGVNRIDWEIYEEPKKRRTVVRWKWAVQGNDPGGSPIWTEWVGFYSEDEARERFKNSSCSVKRLDYTRTEFEEECE